MTRSALVAAALAVSLVSGEASAALMTWELRGNVRAVTKNGAPVDDPYFTSLGVVPGAPYVLTLLVDSSVADANPDPRTGWYDAALLHASFQAGAYYMAFTDLGLRFLRVNADTTIGSLEGPGSVSMSWGYGGAAFGFDVLASALGTFTSDALPVTPQPADELRPYADSLVSLFDQRSAINPAVTGDILGWVIVPEAESLSLVAVAALSLALRRRVMAGGA